MCKENLNLSCLEKFVGHSVFIKNEGAEETFIYNNLQIDYNTYDSIVLIDGNTGCETNIPLDLIYNIESFSEDLYEDYVYISAVHYDWRIYCAEKRPVLPKCFKCGKEIDIPMETIWRIEGMANYGSYYDSPEDNQLVNGLCFCDDCVYSFVGDVSESNELSLV